MKLRSKEEVKKFRERAEKRTKKQLIRIAKCINYPINKSGSKLSIVISLAQHADSERIWRGIAG